MKMEELIEEGVHTSPLTLLSIKDKRLIDKINNYLPYSIGIEIECNKSPTFNIANFYNVPDIMDVSIDSNEQRFRIPNGLRGLICLFNICYELKLNSELNPDSGHHYHIDMTNTYHLLNNSIINKNEKWILNELNSWRYKGTYNTRQIHFNAGHNWMRFQSSFKTAEIRIGNMTFDYEVIIKRLIHACDIIQTLNKQLVDKETIVYTHPNIEQQKVRIKTIGCNNKVNYFSNKLSKLIHENTKSELNITDDDKKQIIDNRVIKI